MAAHFSIGILAHFSISIYRKDAEEEDNNTEAA